MNDKTFDFTSERDFVSRAHCVGLNLQATLQWNEVNEDAISALNELQKKLDVSLMSTGSFKFLNSAISVQKSEC
ncbi:hypothetical protein [Escherichia coli]|uniref:hypothetical protein n=1 Tax=Escherichia coli TaxID=562 RepID=UPI002685FCA0